MSYVLSGYGITAVTLAVYAVRVVLRGRALARTLPSEARRWR